MDTIREHENKNTNPSSPKTDTIGNSIDTNIGDKLDNADYL